MPNFLKKENNGHLTVEKDDENRQIMTIFATKQKDKDDNQSLHNRT